MPIHQQITDWLEEHWVAPAFSGWLLSGVSIFFFAAATNTMAGWLYVISGVIFAMLAIAIVLPGRSLNQIQLVRYPIQPVSAGEPLTIELELLNPTSRPRTLIEAQDLLPHVLGLPVRQSIETIPANGRYRWLYEQPTVKRGVYRWHTVNLRTASPLGLFWCRRRRRVNVSAVVYPEVLPLTQCPLLDEVGLDVNTQVQSAYRSLGATEGVTRTLRPYRWGDSTRLIHWRTSARYGELRVRELEIFTGGQEVVIALDSAIAWNLDHFEQAVQTAASLYFYASRNSFQVSLWTAATGLLRGEQTVLEALAATYAGEDPVSDRRPNLPFIWLTQNSDRLSDLPPNSRWLLWPDDRSSVGRGAVGHHSASVGFLIQPDQELRMQLQSPIKRL